MRKFIFLLIFTALLMTIAAFAAQGCAKSGYGDASNTDSEPEFTITGEAI